MSIKVAEKALRTILANKIKAERIKENSNNLLVLHQNDDIPNPSGALIIVLTDDD